VQKVIGPATARSIVFAFWLGLLVFGLRLLTFSGQPDDLETLAFLTASNNLAQYGRADINPLIWTQQIRASVPAAWGDDGNLYLPSGLGRWIVTVPLIWLGHTLPGLNAVQMGLLTPVISSTLVAMGIALLIEWIGRRAMAAYGGRILLNAGLFLAIVYLGLGRLLSAAPVDLIWLNQDSPGPPLALHLLLPPLIILVMVLVNLGAAISEARLWRWNKHNGVPPEDDRVATDRTGESRAVALTPPWVALSVTVIMTGQMMVGAAHAALQSPQAQTDLSLLTLLPAQAHPEDRFWVASPTKTDAQRLTVRLLAYNDVPLPASIWLEPDAPAATLIEQHQARQLAQAAGNRLWLFEPALRRTDPLGETAAYLGQEAFLLQEDWFEPRGRLTLYTTPAFTPPTIPLGVSFENELILLDFAIASQPNRPGDLLKVYLTWQMAAADTTDFARPPIVAFLHLLDDAHPGRVVVQVDRILVDLPNHHQSPLLPGQTVRQGYALPLPDDLASGSYSLITGLYDLSTVQRLRRTDGSPDDFLYLTTLQIEND